MRGSTWVLVVLVAACDSTPPPDDADLLGKACQGSGECGDYTCADGVCSPSCTAPGDCPAGTECRGFDGVVACYKTRWRGGEGEYGALCPLGATSCAPGWSCIAAGAFDGYAYCTAPCTDDRFCPPGMYCGDPGDGTHKCLASASCAPCALDVECVNPLHPDSLCATDRAGDHVCAKRCLPGGDQCEPGFTCEGTDPATAHCVHLSGSCHGDGMTCAVCDRDSDCATGFICMQGHYGERFCARQCTSNAACSDLAPFDRCLGFVGAPGRYGCVNPLWNSCVPYWSR